MTDRVPRVTCVVARRRGSARRMGLAVALVMAAVSGGVITYFVMTGPKRTRGAEQASGDTPPRAPVVDSQSGRTGRSGLTAGAGKGLSVQVASRSDPSRLAGTITSKTLEPQEANRYTAEQPESHIFLRDGRTIVVKADTARLYIPQSGTGQPESGTLTGHVEISLFDRRPGPIDPSRDPATLTVNTDELTFDLTAWEFFIPDKVRITGPTVSYTGSKLRLLLNQPQERIELLHIATTEELRLRSAERAPASVGAAPGPAASGAPAPAATTAGQAAEATKPAPETFYHAVLANTVRVAQGERTISSDALDLWAHLVGGQLSPSAIAPLRGPSPSSAQSPPSPGAASAVAPPAAGGQPGPASTPGAPPLTPSAGNEDVIITLAGALELRPLDTRPSQLAADEISMSFSSQAEAVRFGEGGRDRGISGTASRVDYGATSRLITLWSDSADGVTIDLAASGQLRCGGMRIDLGKGEAFVTGAGSIAGVVGPGLGGEPAAPVAGTDSRLVRWTDAAEFRFSTAEGSASSSLLSAAMFGDVEAADGLSSLRGGSLAANFYESRGRTGPLSRLVVVGDARADDGRQGGLFCDRLDVSFRRRVDNPAQSDPAWVTASGSAMAVRAGETIGAELIEAGIERDAQGRPVVSEMLADGGAVYESVDGVWASAPEIRASAKHRTASLSGAGAVVGKDGSSVTAEHIDLDGAKRTATVFGAGVFTHRARDEQGRPVEADARWAKSMEFDDRLGVLEARGETFALLRPEPMSERELNAETVRIQLTPAPTAGESTPAAESSLAVAPADRASKRRVQRAEAIGASIDADAGGRAVVVSRTFEPADAPDGRRLAEEIRLEGDRILADDEKGTVDVPSPGTLRIVDVRANPSGERAQSGPGGAEINARGAAKFEWERSLFLDRAAGTATMRQGVRLRHIPLDRSDMTELEGEEVVAHIADVQTDGAAGAVRGRLVRASAMGAVWARLGTKELTADRLEYLTSERLIRAASNPDNDVVLFDPARPTPLKAKLLEWDLARDRVEVKSPGTIIIPR